MGTFPVQVGLQNCYAMNTKTVITLLAREVQPYYGILVFRVQF